MLENFYVPSRILSKCRVIQIIFLIDLLGDENFSETEVRQENFYSSK
jgi:hypothetical protein